MDQQARLPFLGAGGDMGARIRARDWSATLGPASGWHLSLKTLVGVMLAAVQPMFIAWGPQRILLYNDAYGSLLGQKHPDALGRPFFDVWPEVREEIGALFDQVFAGRPIHMEDITLFLDRHGRREEAHFAFSYTPVHDGGTNVVAGLFCSCTDTTSQVLAERGRQAETERQRRLFQRAPGFICILHGPAHTYEFVNDAYVRLFGDRDFVGRTVRDAFPEIAGQGYLDWLDQVYATGERFVAQRTPIRLQATPDQPPEERFLDFIYEPVMDAAGTVTGIFVEGHDVTEAYRAAEALRDSEARLRELNADLERRVVERSLDRGRTWQVSPDLLAVFNPQGYFESANPAWQAVLGWSAEELGRIPFFDLVHLDDMDQTSAAFEQLKRGDPVLRFENRYCRKHGGYRWLSWVAVPESGRLYCSARDITPEKEQAAALAERTRERDQVWRNSRDLLVVIDPGGIFRAINPAWTAILGHDPEEVAGRSFLDFIWPGDAALTQGALEAALSSGNLTGFENRYAHKDGTARWISWHTSREGDLVYASGRDVTAMKAQVEALRQAEEQLRQSQKMEAVGQLTGGIAHDFNNLLAGITGSLELMQARLAQGRTGDLDRYLTAAQGAAKRAAALTHRLLAFTRRQTLDPRPTDLNRLVAGMDDLVRRTAGPAVEVAVAAAPTLWVTLVDPNQLENALLNLCINARDAMPEGGRLTVSTGNAQLGEASGHDLPPGQYVTLCVADTGTGMTPEVVRRAFDPFFTTKPIGMGTGLGLSMIYGFVQQSGGQARIQSAPGEGTTVCLYLPRHFGEADAADEPAGLSAAPRARQGETVLVVDDEFGIAELFDAILTDEGHRVLTAINGRHGLELLAGDRPDLMFLDYMMPVMDGAAMLRAMAADPALPAVPVVMMSSMPEATVAERCSGYVTFLRKPFKIAQVVALAERLLGMDGIARPGA